MDYPFRFYGALASHWHDDALFYEVTFVTAPTPAERTELAEAFERSTRGTVVHGASRWLWSGRYALFQIAIRSTDFDRTMGDVLRALHAAAPIEQVVFHGCMESGDPWTTWSVAQRPIPTAAPAWGRHTFIGEFSQGPRLEAPVTSDPAFDAAQTKAYETQSQAEVAAKKAATQAPGAKPMLLPSTRPTTPKDAVPTRALDILSGAKGIAGKGRYWAVAAKNRLRLADLETGTERDVITTDLPIRCFAVAKNGFVAVGDNVALHVLDASRPDALVRRFDADYPRFLGFVGGGRGLVVGFRDREDPTVLLGLRDGIVCELARFEEEISEYARIVEDEGHTYVSDQELVGFEGAWETMPAKDMVDLSA